MKKEFKECMTSFAEFIVLLLIKMAPILFGASLCILSFYIGQGAFEVFKNLVIEVYCPCNK